MDEQETNEHFADRIAGITQQLGGPDFNFGTIPRVLHVNSGYSCVRIDQGSVSAINQITFPRPMFVSTDAPGVCTLAVAGGPRIGTAIRYLGSSLVLARLHLRDE